MGVMAAERDGELVGLLPDDRYRVLHGPGPLELERRALRGVDLRAVRDRAARVERERQPVGRQVGVHLRGGRHLHLARDVGHEVPVLHHHLRQQHPRVLADGVGDQGLVEDLLRGRGPAHQPAHVPGAQRVGVLGAEVPGRVQGAVGDRHVNRDPCARDDRVHLVAIGHPDAGRAGEGPRPAGPGAERGRELRVLAVGHHVLGVQDPVGHELGQVHHDRRVRPDGVGGDHVDVRVQGRVRRRRASVQPLARPGQPGQHLLAVGRPAAGAVVGLSRPSPIDMNRGHGITPHLRLAAPRVCRSRGARRGRRRTRRWFPRSAGG